MVTVMNKNKYTSSVRFRYLAGLGVVLQVGHYVFQHLASGSLLHSRELRCGVRRSLAVHYLC